MKQGVSQLFIFVTLSLLIVIGILRIAATYKTFWQTFDEPAHIAAGMQWLDNKIYPYDPIHPPLARVMDALGLFLKGYRATEPFDMWAEGNALLHSDNAYEQNLILARLGVLPFFILSTLVVWAWASLYYGKYEAILSVVLYSTLPPILAHSGLATTDMAVTSLLVTALFTFLLWIEKPTLRRSILLGITVGLATLAKFSALIFLPAAGILIALTYLPRIVFSENGSSWNIKQRTAGASLAGIAGILIIWAGYWFSFRTLSSVDGGQAHNFINLVLGSEGFLHNVAYFIVDKVPIPAPEFFSGLETLINYNSIGHPSFFLGEVRETGWWYFFPVALAVKTPLPFLILAALGCVVLVKRSIKQPRNTRLLAPAVAAIAILAVSMLANINIGLRHILPIYPLLAIMAGYGAFMLSQFQKDRGIGVGIVALLLAWQVISSGLAHPDYLAYFNRLAGNHPEEILVDSDLDWGQDLKRLANTIKARGIDKLSVRVLTSSANFGTDLGQLGFPPTSPLLPNTITSGWIAVSATFLKVGDHEFPYDQYQWLEDYEFIEKVGKSIFLYHISR